MANACEVCGLTEFTSEAGFYFCAECGTKSQHHGQEMVAEFDEKVQIQTGEKIRIQKVKKKMQQITSWEQFNYILVGYSDFLVSHGAGEDFKLTVLQLWTAYLRRMEIAFFDKQNPERPRLPMCYKNEDVAIIYNRRKQLKKRKRRASSASGSSLNLASSTAPDSSDAEGALSGPSTISSRVARRAQNRNRKKLLSAEYDSIVASQSSDVNRSLHDLSLRSLNASMSGTDTDASESVKHRAQYSRLARVRMKRKERLSTAHINKHERDTEDEMSCHRKVPKYVKPTDAQHLTWTTMTALLSVALNVNGSDLQLADLIRFHREGHISSRHALQYLPEELDPSCYTKTLHRRELDIMSHLTLRQGTAQLVEFLSVAPVMPDLRKLCVRYLEELCLPADLFVYIDRLMAVFPPKMRHTAEAGQLPNYEGRAMAFIIFVLKLLFGLNDSTELKISKSASKLNRHLAELGRYKPVFVFTEWARYLEMRKVILSQVHQPTNRAVATEQGMAPNVDLFLDHTAKVNNSRDSSGNATNAKVAGVKLRTKQMSNLRDVLGNIVDGKRRDGFAISVRPSIQFEPSLTPYRSYLSTFLLAYNKDKIVHVPNYMQVDHTDRTVTPFVETSNLKEHLLRTHQLSLTTKKAKSARDTFRFVDIAVINESLGTLDPSMAPYLFADDVDEDEWDPPAEPTQRTRSHEDILKQILVRNEVEQLKTRMILDARVPIKAEPADESSVSLFSESMFSSSQLTDESPTTSTSKPHSPPSLLTPNYDYWVRFYGAKSEARTITQFDQRIAPNLPRNFQLVLNECARVVENWPFSLYQELMALEKYFFHAVQPVERFFGGGDGEGEVDVQFEDLRTMDQGAKVQLERVMRDY